MWPAQKSQKDEGAPTRTAETEQLLANLKKVSARGFMFGHHDDTNYGIGWDGDEGRSDVKSVCGDYPAVVSFDLGHIELGDTASLDNVPFSKIRKEILNQYKRGGLSSLSLASAQSEDRRRRVGCIRFYSCEIHPSRWSKSWEVCRLVRETEHFINSLQTEDGVKVPVLFRPWHELTGSWFWWARNSVRPRSTSNFGI